MTDEGRRPIPRPIARQVKEEAGWRCAIPTCRATSALEIAHIIPWSEVRTHTFDNLILLCAICHYRYDRGEIDRASIKNYKANLAVINHRYSDFEQRVLRAFHREGVHVSLKLETGNILSLSMMNLIEDGLVLTRVIPSGVQVNGADIGAFTQVYLSQAGRELITRWFEAEPLDDSIGGE